MTYIEQALWQAFYESAWQAFQNTRNKMTPNTATAKLPILDFASNTTPAHKLVSVDFKQRRGFYTMTLKVSVETHTSAMAQRRIKYNIDKEAFTHCIDSTLKPMSQSLHRWL